MESDSGCSISKTTNCWLEDDDGEEGEPLLFNAPPPLAFSVASSIFEFLYSKTFRVDQIEKMLAVDSKSDYSRSNFLIMFLFCLLFMLFLLFLLFIDGDKF